MKYDWKSSKLTIKTAKDIACKNILRTIVKFNFINNL